MKTLQGHNIVADSFQGNICRPFCRPFWKRFWRIGLALLWLTLVVDIQVSQSAVDDSPPLELLREQEQEPEEEFENGDGYDYAYNHSFWGIDFGVSMPTGSSKRLFTPTDIVFFEAPEPYANYFRAGPSANFYLGMMTEEGFEASIGFHMTKLNFSNEARPYISDENGTYSSYLIGTQVYLGQRIKPVRRRRESLYFGVAAELSSLKHYSSGFDGPDDETFALSFIAGDEIPFQVDPSGFQMLALRIQVEYVALASVERPRFVSLSFGVRYYLR